MLKDFIDSFIFPTCDIYLLLSVHVLCGWKKLFFSYLKYNALVCSTSLMPFCSIVLYLCPLKFGVKLVLEARWKYALVCSTSLMPFWSIVLYLCSLKFDSRGLLEIIIFLLAQIWCALLCSLSPTLFWSMVLYSCFLRFRIKLIVEGFSFSIFWDNIHISPHQSKKLLDIVKWGGLF